MGQKNQGKYNIKKTVRKEKLNVHQKKPTKNEQQKS